MPSPEPPRLLFWETTSGCNLECAHCRRLAVSREMMADDLTTGEAKRFIADLARYAKPILVLSGGEPLVRPDIFELATYAGERGLPVSLATNGTLIDEATAACIAASGIQRVAVSLDGADAGTHDHLRRQPGSFQAALKGLHHLRRAGVALQINCTVTRHNAHQLEDVHAMALALGAGALHFFMLVPVGCGASIEKSHQLEAERYEEVLNWIYEKSKEDRIHMRPICAPHYFRVMRQRARLATQPRFVSEREGREPRRAEGRPVERSGSGLNAMTRGCLAGTGIAFVSHRGEVFPCGYLPLPAGNVRGGSFRDIWETSPLLQDLRDPSRLQGKCGDCEFRAVCSGCRARAWFASGDFLGEEPLCSYVPKNRP